MAKKPPPPPQTVAASQVSKEDTKLVAQPPQQRAVVRPPPTELAESRGQIAPACKGDLPLLPGDPRWEDLALARGDRATLKLRRRFEDKPDAAHLHVLFASHRGAGKTTELMRLQQQLQPRYLSLYLEANVQMDSLQIEVEDLLLALAQGIERCLRELGKPLPAELLQRVSAWFDQVIRTTDWGRQSSVEAAAGIKVEAGLPLFAKITGGLSSLFKTESKYRTEVKNELKKFPGTLLESVNLLLDAAAERLAEDGKELLIVIDNLDRYDPQIIDSLLVRNGDRLRNLRCNLLLTPPISLLYRPHSEQIDTHFPCEVMNTVRLRRRDQPYDAFDGPGRDLLLAALAKRIDLELLLPDKRARDRLIVASGGAIRDMLDIVAEASLYAEDCVQLGDIEAAVQNKKQRLRDMINANGWWGTLAAIARDKQIVNDPACLTVLYYRLVLKYNGDGWYDVLPIIAELPEFQHACQLLAEKP